MKCEGVKDMEYDFHNTVVMITGGAQGLGYVLAGGFHSAGAKVALVDVNEKKLKEATELLGRDVKPFVCDITNPGAVAVAVKNIERELGSIHVLVNNAGVVSTEHLLDTSPENWRKIIDVNLSGTFYCLQAVAKSMVKKETKGRIINISSLAGRNGGIMVSPAYSASKAGILGLTKAAARQLASYGITVNAVAPGSLDSEMLLSFGEGKVKALKEGMPLGRLGSFQDVQAAVLFLASPEAEFIDGVCLDVNGGQFMAP